MNNYKNKYLKYKNKYLNLKNLQIKQTGGIGETFYLYVLGIVDGIRIIDWHNELLPIIINKIPPYFSDIKIIYYDPFETNEYYNRDTDETFSGEAGKKKFLELFYEATKPIPRVSSVIFNTTYFTRPVINSDLFTKKKYLIIDFAHLFLFSTTRSHYLRWYRDNPVISRKTSELIYLEYSYNVLYFTYFFQPNYLGFYPLTMIYIDFVDISENQVITWIDKLLIKKYTINELHPYLIFKHPINKFTKKTIEKYIELHGNESRHIIESKFNKELCKNMLIIISNHMFREKLEEPQIINILENTFERELLK